MTQEDPRILELRRVRAKAREGGGEGGILLAIVSKLI